MFENIKADLARLSPSGRASFRILVAGLLSQGFQAVLVYRFFNWCYRNSIPGQPLRFIIERFIEITTGISIPARCRIGKGLRIFHFGGVIFHPSTVMGDNCTVYQGVTIGDRGGCGDAAKIGNNVLIGAGAKIVGEIAIGDDCVIGANAVVSMDLPAHHIATCSPCRIREMQTEYPVAQIGKNIPLSTVRIMDLRGTYKGGGGPDKTILNSAVLHDKGKVEVLVTYLRQPDDNEYQIPHMAAERKINYIDLKDRCFLDIKCVWRLRQLCYGHNIQVIHTHDDKTMLYACLLKWITSGVKLLHTCHSHAEYGRDDFPSIMSWWRFCFRKKVQIFLMKRHNYPIITVSENTRQRLIRGGLSPGRVNVLLNAIDTSVWSSEGASPILRKELSLQNGDFLVGTVARITYDKDLPTFYEVARLVTERIPNSRFIIVGDGYGNELTEAQAEVKQLGLADKVYFAGHRSDLKNVYSSLDLFLMTSRTEGMPNTVLEAMALGLPVVSTDVGGVSELVIAGETGILCSPGHAEVLADAVCRLLTDENLRQKFGRAARKRIEKKFDFTGRVRTLEDIYSWFAGEVNVPSDVLSKL